MRAIRRAVFIIALTGAAYGMGASESKAASAEEINATADQTLRSFVRQVPGAKEIAQKAAGVLVFPSVVKAGIGLGGEYGEGLRRDKGGNPGCYYNIVSASFGFQLGVQERSTGSTGLPAGRSASTVPWPSSRLGWAAPSTPTRSRAPSSASYLIRRG